MERRRSRMPLTKLFEGEEMAKAASGCSSGSSMQRARRLAARLCSSNSTSEPRVTSACDLLDLSEFDVAALSCVDDDVTYDDVDTFFKLVVEAVAPPFHPAFDMEHMGNAHFASTGVPDLDAALGGGISARHITELVGQAGAGKSQFCLTASVLAAASGKLVYYIDADSKISPGRLVEIAKARRLDDLQGMLNRILIIRLEPGDDFEKTARDIESDFLKSSTPPGLLVVDSVASPQIFACGDHGRRKGKWTEKSERLAKHEMIARHGTLLKRIANSINVPVLVTNQVKVAANASSSLSNSSPVLGNTWAHSVNVRIFVENYGTERAARIAKSPSAVNKCVPFAIASNGVSTPVEVAPVLNDDALDEILTAMPEDTLKHLMAGNRV